MMSSSVVLARNSIQYGISSCFSKEIDFSSRISTRIRANIVHGSSKTSLNRSIKQDLAKINGNASSKLTTSSYPVKSSPQTSEKDEETLSTHNYMQQSMEIIKLDNGPPRWFCPLSSGKPSIENAPLLLFLPGMEGTGLGLLRHYKSLGPLFEVRCLHIPVKDRTPFEGLLDIVESTVKAENICKRDRPIYLVGDSFGSTLALAVAARNPSIDLVLILANPATSIARSQLRPLFPILELDAFQLVPYLLSFTMGDPVRMATIRVSKDTQQSLERSQKLADALKDLLQTLPGLQNIIPKETLIWKLKLMRAGALYANSRLHAVKAEVLVLASGKDQILPSVDEAKRLQRSLENCKVRVFNDSGHTLLLEDRFNLVTNIKCTFTYRRSRQRDAVYDYVMPTEEEQQILLESTKVSRQLFSPVFLSTNEDGQVVKGLSAFPKDRPLLLVGNHMLMGFELYLIASEILKEKKLLVRGLALPHVFTNEFRRHYSDVFNDDSFINDFCLFGATPVSDKNFYKLLKSKYSVLLYPGGAREALHYKGEEYKLFWPEQSEFVRTAARFGATILPFSCVGEDDMVELLVDYNGYNKISFLRDNFQLAPNSDIRPASHGEVANQPLYLPIVAPKIPGRIYVLFGKPIRMEGRNEEVRDRKKAHEVYLTVKREVESGISYLLKKRQEDPYRNALPRFLYEASWGGTRQSPSFDP